MLCDKVVKYLLNDGKMEPNVKDEILQVFKLNKNFFMFISGIGRCCVVSFLFAIMIIFLCTQRYQSTCQCIHSSHPCNSVISFPLSLLTLEMC